jgi:hypothetical protein
MSKVLTTTAAIVIMLDIAASVPAQARGANFDRDPHPWAYPNNSVLVNYHPGYSGPVLYAHPVRDKCGSRSVAVCATHRRWP